MTLKTKFQAIGLIISGFAVSTEINGQINSYAKNNIEVVDQSIQNLGKHNKFKFGFSWDGEIVTNHSGGIQTGVGYFGKIGVNLQLSLKDFGIANGGKFKIHAINVHGDTPTSRLIGDFQPVSRNEASDRIGLFEFWYEHSFNQTKVTIGQHDMNSTFGTSRIGGNSIHSAFGVFPSASPNLGYAFSIYPRTMPGIYVNHQVDRFIVKGALYAGSSYAFGEDRHNLRWNLNDSGFFISEITYRSSLSDFNLSEYKFGVFKHTGEFPGLDVTTLNTAVSPELGFYSIIDQSISEDNRISVFAEATYFPGDHNFAKLFYATGFEVKEPIKVRPNDVLFFGFLSTSLSDQALTQVGFDESTRSILELNYSFSLPNGFSITPDLQYIINPGANSTLDNALVSIIKISYKI